MTGSRTQPTNASVANPDISLVGVQYERNPEAEPPNTDHVMGTGAICNTSASHSYGNVLAVVEKYLLDIFPPDTFNTVTATTTLASRQLLHLPRQLMKRQSPMMVLAPRISFGQEDNRFLAHTLINSRFTNTFATWGESSLIPLSHDRVNRIKVHGHYNRSVLYIDVVLSFNTYMEQINWMSFLHNMIPINHNFFIRAPLELYLPTNFCQLLAGLSKHELTGMDRESIYNFLTYMNSTWYHPITYKLRGSSNTDDFFMYYLADIDTVVQDPQAGAGIKDGQIKRNFEITFTVRCDFNTIGYFAVNCPGIREPLQLHSGDSDAIVPIFTDVIDLGNFYLPVGWSILAFPIFRLDVDKDERSVSIEPILNSALRTVIDHHVGYGIPIERFLRLQFRENGVILDNESFYVDWVNRELTVMEPDYHRTYRLLISVSHDYVNNFIVDHYGLE